MAINPANYMIQSADPLGKGIEGYGQMLSLRGAENTLKQQAFAQAQAQAQAKRQEQLRADMTNYAQNPTMEGIKKLRATYPEAKALDKIFESKTEEQKRNTANRAFELISIIDSGKTDLLKSELTSEVEALDKRGQVEDARRKRTLIKLLDTENNLGLSSIKSALLAEGEAATGGKFSDMYKEETARTEGQQELGLKERELTQEKSLKERQLQSEEDKLRLEREKFGFEKTKMSDLTKETRKEALKLTASGHRPISKLKRQDLQKLPGSAFVTVGFGDDAMTFVKPPQKVTGEAASKLTLLTKGRNEYVNLLNAIKSNQYTHGDIRLAATKGVKNLPRLQPVKNKLNSMVEALARNLSGAAVKDDELDRFRDIFSIKKFDSDVEIQNKLTRAVEIADRVEQMVLYGATPDEKAELIIGEIEKDGQNNQELKQAVRTNNFMGYELPIAES